MPYSLSSSTVVRTAKVQGPDMIECIHAEQALASFPSYMSVGQMNY